MGINRDRGGDYGNVDVGVDVDVDPGRVQEGFYITGP